MSIAIALIVAVIVLILILAAMRPDDFRIERTTGIKTAPEKIFALINDFHQWRVWSPWEAIDPALVRTYSGAAAGAGAVYAWSGNSKAGEGRMEISETRVPSKIVIRIDFARPMKASNTVEFTLVAQGGETQISWAMHGRTAFVAKIFHLFFNMDRLVGKDFEAGLANLKAAAETGTT